MKSFSHWLRVFLCGLCMGAADIVPGVSGGTMAWITGIYEELLDSIRSVNVQALRLLGRGHFLAFFAQVKWKFLATLGLGMITAIITVAHLIQSCLNDATYRSYLYAGFLGLILSSILYCAKQVRAWHREQVIALVVGAAIALALTSFSLSSTIAKEAHFSYGINWWVMCCGAIAVSAMLLPGISGAYLLTILGMYSVVIGALTDFTHGIRELSFDTPAFFVLVSLSLGILTGAAFFSRAIGWLFFHYRCIAIALLTGFMIGALRVIWPFWTVRYYLNPLKLDQGPLLEVVKPVLPDPLLSSFWIACGIGIAAFIGVTAFHTMTYKTSHKTDTADAEGR